MRGAHLAALAALVLSGCGSSTPPTAAQVAAQVGASRFTDCGPAPLGGVTDSGTAYLGTERIGVDTFPGSDVRDRWLKEARDFGVAPLREGDTWVTYRATDQSGPRCP